MSMIVKMFKVKRIRNAIFFTLFIMLIYQIGNFLTVPGVDAQMVTSGIGTLETYSIMNILSGGALERFSIFSLGVTPYITASIVIELLSNDVIPVLTEWKEDGAKGRKKINKVTQCLGVVLALVQGITLTITFDRAYGILETSGFSSYLYTGVLLAAGSMFLIWLGNKITQYGIGSGLSIIIVAGILSSLPSTFVNTFAELSSRFGSNAAAIPLWVIYVISYLLIILGVVFMNTGERRIKIMYPSHRLNNGSNMTYLPIKPGVASVIPVIFASSLMTVPLMIVSFFNYQKYLELSKNFTISSPLGLVVYAILIMIFTYFYSDLILNPAEISKTLKNNNGYVVGKRPGKETEDYLHKVIFNTVTVGAIGLVILALMPYLLSKFINLSTISAIGGTGAILVVGISLEIINTLEAQVASEKYKGWF